MPNNHAKSVNALLNFIYLSFVKFQPQIHSIQKQKERNLGYVDFNSCGIETAGRVGIYDHLTPKSQELFNKAKEFQKSNGYMYCWTKNATIMLKKSDASRIEKITSLTVLEKLAELSNRDGAKPWTGTRGRGSGTGTGTRFTHETFDSLY